eukprot:3774797-Lingulodinium_polyedra.AAC.1
MGHFRTDGGGYAMDQLGRVAAMKPSATVEGKSTQLAPAEIAKQFLSLLMALAFAALAGPDLVVYLASHSMGSPAR